MQTDSLKTRSDKPKREVNQNTTKQSEIYFLIYFLYENSHYEFNRGILY